MPAGRPYGPNDPSLMSSLETAVRRVRRPGLVEFTWNWRWEIGLLAVLAGPAGLVTSAFGLIGLIVTAGAGLAVSIATLLLRPPMVPSPGLVPHHAAPGPGRLRECLGPDQERQAAVHRVHHPRAVR